MLRSTPVFHETTDEKVARWSYQAPTAPHPSSVLTSLTALSSSIPKSPEDRASTRGLFQTLTDLTAFLTSHAYGLSKTSRGTFGDVRMSPEAEEVRKEIRALKGLVLNRSVAARPQYPV
jgi:hypothetical protein